MQNLEPSPANPTVAEKLEEWLRDPSQLEDEGVEAPISHPIGNERLAMASRDSEIIAILFSLRQQNYPLGVNEEAANALVECLRRVMDAVPADDRVLVRGDYDLATSALCHPETNLPRTNERLT